LSNARSIIAEANKANSPTLQILVSCTKAAYLKQQNSQKPISAHYNIGYLLPINPQIKPIKSDCLIDNSSKMGSQATGRSLTLQQNMSKDLSLSIMTSDEKKYPD